MLAENGLTVARRYFPSSIGKWMIEHPCPANVFARSEAFECEVCGSDLVQPTPRGVFVLWSVFADPVNAVKGDQFIDAYWCCRGQCDHVLKQRTRQKHDAKLCDGWIDVAELCIPLLYIRKVVAFLNGFQRGDRWSPEAFEKMKTLLIALYPYVTRDPSIKERQRIDELMQIPTYLGGLGIEH